MLASRHGRVSWFTAYGDVGEDSGAVENLAVFLQARSTYLPTMETSRTDGLDDVGVDASVRSLGGPVCSYRRSRSGRLLQLETLFISAVRGSMSPRTAFTSQKSR